MTDTGDEYGPWEAWHPDKGSCGHEHRSKRAALMCSRALRRAAWGLPPVDGSTWDGSWFVRLVPAHRCQVCGVPTGDDSDHCPAHRMGGQVGLPLTGVVTRPKRRRPRRPYPRDTVTAAIISALARWTPGTVRGVNTDHVDQLVSWAKGEQWWGLGVADVNGRVERPPPLSVELARELVIVLRALGAPAAAIDWSRRLLAWLTDGTEGGQ